MINMPPTRGARVGRGSHGWGMGARAWEPWVGHGCQGGGTMAWHNSCAIMDKHRRIYYEGIYLSFLIHEARTSQFCVWSCSGIIDSKVPGMEEHLDGII